MTNSLSAVSLKHEDGLMKSSQWNKYQYDIGRMTAAIPVSGRFLAI